MHILSKKVQCILELPISIVCMDSAITKAQNNNRMANGELVLAGSNFLLCCPPKDVGLQN